MTVEGGDEDRVRLHSFQHLRDTGQVWVWAAGLGPLAGDSCEEEPVGPTSTKDACRKLTNVTESQKPGGPRDTQGTGVRVGSTIGFQILPVQAALSLRVDGEAELR